MAEKPGKFFIPPPDLAEAFKKYNRTFADVAPTDHVPKSRLSELIPLIYAAIDSGKKLTTETIAAALKLPVGR